MPRCLGRMELLSERWRGPIVFPWGSNVSFGDNFTPWSLWGVLGQRWRSVFGQHHRLQVLPKAWGCTAASALQGLCPLHSWAPLKESQSPRGEPSVLRAAVPGERDKQTCLQGNLSALPAIFFFLLLKHSENTLRLIWGSQRLMRSHPSLGCALDLKSTRCFAELKGVLWEHWAKSH